MANKPWELMSEKLHELASRHITEQSNVLELINTTWEAGQKAMLDYFEEPCEEHGAEHRRVCPWCIESLLKEFEVKK